MTHFQMYLITRAEVFGFTLAVFGTIILLGVMAVLLFHTVEGMKLPKPWKPCFVASLIMIFLSCLIPSTKSIALIYVVPAIVNNQDVQAIPPELAKLAKLKLEEMVKDSVSK